MMKVRVITCSLIWEQSDVIEVKESPDEFKEREAYDIWRDDLLDKANETEQKVLQSEFKDYELEWID